MARRKMADTVEEDYVRCPECPNGTLSTKDISKFRWERGSKMDWCRVCGFSMIYGPGYWY